MLRIPELGFIYWSYIGACLLYLVYANGPMELCVKHNSNYHSLTGSRLKGSCWHIKAKAIGDRCEIQIRKKLLWVRLVRTFKSELWAHLAPRYYLDQWSLSTARPQETTFGEIWLLPFRSSLNVLTCWRCRRQSSGQNSARYPPYIHGVYPYFPLEACNQAARSGEDLQVAVMHGIY